MNLPPPELVTALADRYRLDRELGHGGMATVYLAEDLKHHRQVAIKVLRPEPSAVLGPERFEREIATLARLAHPHILPLHDLGLIEVRGQRLPYFVMPFIAGDSLRQRLQREHQLPVDTALGIARGLALAIDGAHQSGILHRDLKPENILMAGDEPLIADFGIARAIDAAGGERLTETGLVIGTAAYMSPEQAAGSRDLDERSDGYSLACVVYEMLAGEPPFTGPTPQAVIARRFTGRVPSISQIRERIPPEVDQVFARALARTPADRFATAAAFVQALGTAAASGTVPSGDRTALMTTERAPALRARRIRAVVLVAAGAVIGLGIWLRGGRTPVSLDANLVAVAPFDVFEPSLQVYHEGFVDLLSRGIDGAGPLRTVAPTLAIRRWTGRSDRASAIDLGRRTGAALVVIGQVTPTGPADTRVLDTLTTTGLAVALLHLQRWPDSAETGLRLARRLPFISRSGSPGSPEILKRWLVTQLAVRGHVREAATLNSTKMPEDSPQALTELALLGALPAAGAAATFAHMLSSRDQ